MVPAPGMPRAPRLDQLWCLLALTIVGGLVALAPTSPSDFWWHVRVGEWIASSGAIPRINRFAWTVPAEQPFVYAAWLGEWLFYQLFQLGGLPLAVCVRNLLALASFGLIALEARRRSGSWRLAGLAVLLLGLMMLNNVSTRTQNWAWLPFALTTALLGRYADQQLAPRTLLIGLPLIMLFWVNVHGSFLLGPILTGLWLCGETLRRLLRQPRGLSWAHLRWLGLALLLSSLATLINPWGAGILVYVVQLSGSIPGREITDWLPPTPQGLAGLAFFASVLMLAASWAFARRRPSISDVLASCALLWLAFGGARHVAWFGMLAMPILAQSLAAPRSTAAAVPGPQTPGMAVANSLLAGLLLLLVLLLQPWFKPFLPLPAAYAALFAELPGAPLLAAADTPVAAAEYLRAHPGGPDERLFNELGYGSYLIWAAPAERVFIDTRIELFPDTLWNDYVALNEGHEVDELLIGRYKISRALVDQQLQPRLLAALQRSPAWELEWSEGRSFLFRRRE